MKTSTEKFLRFIYYFGLLAVVTYFPGTSFAQWSTNPYANTIICIEEGSQGAPMMTSDGAGGAIIAWHDTRNDAGDIYAQRIDVNGVIQWTANGIPISIAPSLQAQPTIASDGNGGAIITWADFRDITDPNNPNVDINIYSQRVNGNGIVQWPGDVAICKAQGEQTYPLIVADGSGGAIISWTDKRSFSGQNYDVYALGIKSDGSIKWPEQAVTSNTGNQVRPAIVSDNSGGAIITWVDGRNAGNGLNASDIYAQRINSDGILLWSVDGVGVCVTDRFQDNPAITTDGSNGAIISWLDDRHVAVNTSNKDLFAQRINSAGVVQWTTNGIGISTTSEQQISHSISSDLAGGAVFAWETWTGYVSNIRVQRVNGSGSHLWMADGVPIGSGGKRLPTVFFDNGTTFLVWEDDRNSGKDIYGQKLDSNGTEQWAFGGVVISNAYGNQSALQVRLDNQGGAIISWSDSRNTSIDIYAQHVKPDGTLGGASVVGGQTITFNTIPAKKFSDAPFNPGAIASSSLPVTYTSSNLAVATIEGSSVTITGVGNSTITASQSGDANFAAATPVAQTLTVTKGDQFISFNTLPSKSLGDAAFQLSATSTSDLIITYTSSNTSVATVSGNTVTIVGSGVTNITASQAGDANYNAASMVVQVLTVKTSQSISFNTISDKTFGDPAFTLAATTTSGLPVSYSTTSDKISISTNQVTILKAGSNTIDANQVGNSVYSAAPQASQTFCINPAKPIITVNGLGTSMPTLTSSSTSGNQWYREGIAISGATNANYTVDTEGNYTVIVKADNCTSLSSDAKSFVITGLEISETEVMVYPNPMDRILNVDISKWGTGATLVMYDMRGQTIHTTSGSGLINIDVDSYPSGIYLLRIQNATNVITKKLTK